MQLLPPIHVDAAGIDWPFEVQLALPATYNAQPHVRYPVLWLTDGAFYLPLAVGLLNLLTVTQQVPEMIVVAVGSAPEVGVAEGSRRRNSDFLPPGRHAHYEGFAGERLQALAAMAIGANDHAAPAQLADRFLAFLVDLLRPQLAADYRMSDEHGLFGHSGGGGFAGWVLFERPDAFAKYIIGSPSLNAVDRLAFRQEAAFAAKHSDHPASVFLAAGEQEILDGYMAAWGIVSSFVLLAETLKLRNYASLKLHARIFPGKDHLTVVPDILLEGLRALWPMKTSAA